MTELTLEISRTINAPAEKLFNAWLDPAMLARFMIPGEGMAPPKVQTDPREGGEFHIVMQGAERELPHSGTYLKITRHSQIVFTWESEFSIDGSTVTLDFTPEGDATRIDLTQVKFFNEEARDNHKGGWANILSTLDDIAASAAVE